MKTGVARPSDPALRIDQAPARVAPVKIWASAGFVSLTVVAVGWCRWILSGPSAAPVGPDQLGGTLKLYLEVVQWTAAAVALYVVWRFLVKPIIKERRLTLDGILIIAGATCFFYDPMDNYFTAAFMYNAHFIDLGTWAEFIPGWRSPTAYPEPLVALAMYVWLLFGGILIGCALMRTMAAWRPQISLFSLFLTCLTVFAIADFVMEALATRTQLWAYPAASRFLTAWPDMPYQYPLHNAWLVGALMAALTTLRYVRDDHGRSYVERGVAGLHVSPRLGRTLSTLAVVGAFHTFFIVIYIVPFNWMIGLRGDTMPRMPSYMRAGMCGEGTRYACAGKEVPIPSQTSIHVTPDDPRLSDDARRRQGVEEPVEEPGG